MQQDDRLQSPTLENSNVGDLAPKASDESLNQSPSLFKQASDSRFNFAQSDDPTNKDLEEILVPKKI